MGAKLQKDLELSPYSALKLVNSTSIYHISAQIIPDKLLQVDNMTQPEHLLTEIFGLRDFGW